MGKIRTAGINLFKIIIPLALLIVVNPSWSAKNFMPLWLPARLEQEKGPNIISSSIESAQASEEMLKIHKFLEKKNSPMSNNSVDFYNASKEYRIDPYLLPAIAGVESSFGQALIPNSYNPFGWNNGRYYFNSYQEAIFTVAKSLREKYAPTGEINPQRIGRTYATSWPTWIPKVESLSIQIKSTSID